MRRLMLCGILGIAGLAHKAGPHPSTRIGDLLFEGWSTVDPAGQTIRSTGRVTFMGATGRGHLEIAADCSVVLRVYDADEPAGPPVWDGLRKRRMCFDMTRLLDLEPGQSVVFSQVDSVATILGQASPSRGYRLSVLFRLSGAHLELPSREIVHLARQREPPGATWGARKP